MLPCEPSLPAQASLLTKILALELFFKKKIFVLGCYFMCLFPEHFQIIFV